MNSTFSENIKLISSILFGALITAFLNSCAVQSESNRLGSIALVDSVSIDLRDFLPENYERVSKLSLRTVSDSVYVNIFNHSDTSYYSINIQSRECRVFNISELFPQTLDAAHRHSFTLQSRNDLLITNPDNFLFRFSTVSDASESIALKTDVTNFEHYSFAQTPSIYSKNQLFALRAYRNFDRREEKGRLDYYESAPYSSIDVNTGLVESVGDFQSCFDFSDDRIGDVYTQICFNSDSTVVLNGYKYCEDVGIHHLHGDGRFESRTLLSNSKPEFKLVKASELGNIKLKQTTELSSAAYLNLVNDPYNDLYIRAYKKYIDLSDSIILPDQQELDWTLRIWDDEFAYVGEVSLDKRNQIFPYFFAVSEMGWYFMRWNKDDDSDPFSLKLMQYQYTRN